MKQMEPQETWFAPSPGGGRHGAGEKLVVAVNIEKKKS